MLFEHAMPFVLQREGEYVDHPNDRGGATNKGVTQRTYDTWRAKNGNALRSVRYIEDNEVNAIYFNNYWLEAVCDRLPDMVDLFVFDSAVNHGPRRAIKFLQTAVSAEPDGLFGPNTWNALQYAAPVDVLTRMFAARRDFYAAIIRNDPSQKVFEAGWENRVSALEARVERFV